MTAEVGVMNKHGVALAADSAGTISNSNGGRKIYNYSEKLFCISENSPIGLMIYASANIIGIPWGVVVKEYRKKYHDKFGTLEEHSDNFFCYLSQLSYNKNIVEEEKLLIQRLLMELINSIKHDVKINAIKKNLSLEDKSDLASLISEQISVMPQKISSFKISEGFTEDDIVQLRSDYLQLVEDILNSNKLFTIEDSQGLGSAEDRIEIERIMLQSKQIFIDSFFSSLIRINLSTNIYTGIVIAGYGDDDWLPKLRHYRVFGILNRKLIYSIIEENEINSKVPATINAFAQNEMVFSYLQGIHPSVMRYVNDYENRFWAISNDPCFNNMPMMNTLKQTHSTFFTALSKELNTSINSVIYSIGELPKPELANMAETLVNLTSFKQRITMTDETVGGPIDVALITKSEGFIWIKRKYYFDPKINNHYFRR